MYTHRGHTNQRGFCSNEPPDNMSQFEYLEDNSKIIALRTLEGLVNRLSASLQLPAWDTTALFLATLLCT
jgi:hypothetical protein